ncbi:MAG: UDP-glucose 4-epimerase GalE [Methylomonas sp.]|nr:UDP-glucose 4-epimerase GalE [Methylomonas sp.]PPD21936.1 MAG: UDP-glucose 4-epimerase GalE [Methylomonas sp.]PPD26078.1 MAG: UDP-glucose 4-epimerase GalE [Methylomonas sp.]PPD37796.1 MAG: UDP-glucose 4-epimerase GalE [Methylomonas sp.]PPD40634.1 MAG: UDP-glucose 4-epimerase GalE [Methylomonas sp.]
MTQTILVTGGAGYIGSHTCVALLDSGYEVVIIDNLSNSKIESVRRIERISGRKIAFHQTDINDRPGLTEIFVRYPISAVIHFAGLKAVGESCQLPLAYYHNNISGTLTLLEVMSAHDVKQLVFSSSATVYGDPHCVPIVEDFPLQATNPYGRTKLFIEDILRDAQNSDHFSPGKTPWQIAILRYFNPIGAHHSGLIGEDPNGIPNNLMPYLSQVAIGKLEILSVFGSDYATHDGTGVRDYIHVVDLAQGHIKALAWLMRQEHDASLCEAFNLGTGNGYSVLDMVKTFSAVIGRPLPYRMTERRPGDVAACYADPSRAKQALGWQAERDLNQMMTDTWRWQSQNPDGYD